MHDYIYVGLIIHADINKLHKRFSRSEVLMNVLLDGIVMFAEYNSVWLKKRNVREEDVEVERLDNAFKKLKYISEEEKQDLAYEILIESIDSFAVDEPDDELEEAPLENFLEGMLYICDELDGEIIEDNARLHAIRRFSTSHDINTKFRYLPFSLGYCLIFLCKSMASIKATLDLLFSQGFDFNSPENESLLEMIICLRNRNLNVTNDNCAEIICHLVKKSGVRINDNVLEIARSFNAGTSIVNQIQILLAERFCENKVMGKWPLASNLSLKILSNLTTVSHLTSIAHVSKSLWSLGKEALFNRIQEMMNGFIMEISGKFEIDEIAKEHLINNSVDIMNYCSMHKSNSLACFIYIEQMYISNTNQSFRCALSKIIEIYKIVAIEEFNLKSYKGKINYLSYLFDKIKQISRLDKLYEVLKFAEQLMQNLVENIPADDSYKVLIQSLIVSYVELHYTMWGQFDENKLQQKRDFYK